MKKEYNKKYFIDRDVLTSNIAWIIKLFAKDIKARKILDVGCGTGKLVKFLDESGFNVAGCDNSQEAVNFARKKNNPKLIVKATATKLPFKANTYDLVTSISVIEHLTESEGKKLVREAKRILSPGGFIFLITPNFASFFRRIQGKNWFAYKDPTHVFYYTPDSLRNLLSESGFTNFKFYFKVKYDEFFDWDFPSLFAKLPRPLKYLAIYLFYCTPFMKLRNAFFVAAQKPFK